MLKRAMMAGLNSAGVNVFDLEVASLPVTRLARLARADANPARLLRGTDLDAFVGAAVPLTDQVTDARPHRPGTWPTDHADPDR